MKEICRDERLCYPREIETVTGVLLVSGNDLIKANYTSCFIFSPINLWQLEWVSVSYN